MKIILSKIFEIFIDYVGGTKSILNMVIYIYVLVNIQNNISIINVKEKFDDYTKIIAKEYNFSNIDLNFEDKHINDIITYMKSNNIKLDKLYLDTMIDDVTLYHLNTENLLVIKEYIKNYNNHLLIKWIIDLVNPNVSQRILDANCKINSFYDEIKYRFMNNPDTKKINNNLYGVQSNSLLRDIQIFNDLFRYNKLSNNTIISNNILTDDVYINDSNDYDLIFMDMPSGIHNIIHANCCKKVKKLKLRGTKAEPLLLQLVMLSLNKNGKAILIVPDLLLYSESNQVIETRQYLLSNFNITKIIEIDESIYTSNKITKDLRSLTNTIKNSIIYFENTGKTTNIQFSRITQENNQINEQLTLNINAEKLNSNISSLYYKNYLNKHSDIESIIQFKKIDDLFIFNNILVDQVVGPNMLVLNKYHTDESIKIIPREQIKEQGKNNIILYEKQDKTLFIENFLIHFLEYKIKTNPSQFIKGAMNQYDINKIKLYQIPLIEISKQQVICKYIDITNKLISDNNSNIEIYNNLIKYTMETIPRNKYINLELIVDIYKYIELTDQKIDILNNKLIGIVKNGLTAGTVYLPNEKLSNNSYYLIIKDSDENKFLQSYVYYYLKFIQNKIFDLANLTQQPTLTKPLILLSIQISHISTVNQLTICNDCDLFNQNIQNCIQSNIDIKQRDIMGTLLKLNSIL